MKELTFITVYHKDGTDFQVSTEYEEMLDAAFERYLGRSPSWQRESDSDGDELLRFVLVGGNQYRCLVSSIYSWLISTPEGRRGKQEVQDKLEAERSGIPAIPLEPALIS
jgi:hypothetical protein